MGSAVPTDIHQLTKGSRKPSASCCLGLLFLGISKAKGIIFSYDFFCFVFYKKIVFKDVRERLFVDVVMTIPSSLLIPSRSAKPGHVYACGTFHLGSGEKTF